MKKDQIRDRMKCERNSLSKEEQMALDRAIHKRLFDLKEYGQCKSLFSYVSFQSEIDTFTVIDQAFNENKRVFVPRVEEKDMDFYEIYNTDSLIESKLGILEPQKDEEVRYYANRIDKKKVMLLPGLAFDSLGNRIGYGAGYYDRYLARYLKDKFIFIALAYDFQIQEQIPSEEYDIKVDLIITPKKTIQCRLD